MQIYKPIFSSCPRSPHLPFSHVNLSSGAFQEENGTGQVNLNESRMGTGGTERKVVPHKNSLISQVSGSKEPQFTLAAVGAQL